MMNSVGGGTGSGLGAYLLREVVETYGPKMPKVNLAVYPSPNLTQSPMEAYNAVLNTSFLINSVDMTILVDNEATAQT